MTQAKLQDATAELHKMHFMKCFKQHVITWPAVYKSQGEYCEEDNINQTIGYFAMQNKFSPETI